MASESSSNATAAAIVTVLGLCAVMLILLYGLYQVSKQWKLMIFRKLQKALKMRRKERDEFREKYGYSWDLFLTFPVYDEDEDISQAQRQYSMQRILDKLTSAGLETRLFYSMSRKEVFCKVRCPLPLLERHADMVDYKLPFDPEALKTLCSQGREGLWDPLKIPERSDMTTLSPYVYIHGAFEFDSDLQRARPDVAAVYKRWPRDDVESWVRGDG
eukprot:gene37049-44963_t